MEAIRDGTISKYEGEMEMRGTKETSLKKYLQKKKREVFDTFIVKGRHMTSKRADVMLYGEFSLL